MAEDEPTKTDGGDAGPTKSATGKPRKKATGGKAAKGARAAKSQADPSTGKAGAKNNPAGAVKVNREDRIRLYATRRTLGLELQQKLKVRIPFDVYFKDPLRASSSHGPVIDRNFYVPWEPAFSDGPTSARFAVVDYDATANRLEPPAGWDRKRYAFFGTKSDNQGKKLDGSRPHDLQFHQVSCWAVLQATLDYFESGYGLGRRILWGFESNRLIVVPHAGYGENAYYDRGSKSLQFYYFDDEGGKIEDRIYTCLSSDIVNHEFGHALLDGIRPHYLEAVSPETAAFHEFMGDLTAILRAFRNNDFRKQFAEDAGKNLARLDRLANIAPQFGQAVNGQEYLRSASNTRKLGALRGSLRPHDLSEVLTGAMFDILVRLTHVYFDRTRRDGRKTTAAEALAHTAARMQGMAVQPLDFLPPMEVTFRDYALAVLRAELVANPTDPEGYRQMMTEIFVEREILTQEEARTLLERRSVFDRLQLTVSHNANSIAESRANAYRFLDDNRVNLFIPAQADLLVAEVFTAQKLTREGVRMPKQILVQYLWREELLLEGPDYGAYAGRMTSLLCGGTLVLDENGNVISWMRKPGSVPTLIEDEEEEENEEVEEVDEKVPHQKAGKSREGSTSPKTKKVSRREAEARLEVAEGLRRRKEFLETLKRRIAAGMVGEVFGGAVGLLAGSVPPLTSRMQDGMVRFELTPHLKAGHDHHDENEGGDPWQLSS